MRRRWTLLGLSTFACGPASEPQVGQIAVGPPLSPPVLVAQAPESTEGGADLFGPTAVRRVGSSIWLVDAGNDRLVRFDSTLTRATTYGREGQGPGELEFPSDLVTDGAQLLVAEAGNGRVSVFDSSGAFRRIVGTRDVPTALAAVAGDLFAVPGAPGFYTRHAASGRGHARVPERLAALARSDPLTYPPANPFMAAPPNGPVYVVDASVLAVLAFARSGRLLAVRLLPEPYRGALLERRRDQMRAWGSRAASFLSAPVTKRISMDDRGRILVPFPLPDHWGLLIDPTDWSAHPLPLPADQPARDILWSAADASLSGDRLYVLSQDHLYEFRVTGWP